MKTFFLILAILPLIWCQVPVLEVQHYLSASNATIREAFAVDLSQIGTPFTLEVAIIKSADMVTGRGEVEADFSLFATQSSTDDLFDFDGDDFEWNTGSNAISSNRTFARVFHPNCYSLLRGEQALNTVRMEFTSELKDLESYNPSSVIFTRYAVYAMRIDLAADGSTQSRQTSSWASQTPLTLIVGNPSQNDQGIYDVTVSLSNPTGSALPFNLARIGSPNLCIDEDDTVSEDETQLVTIPTGSSYSFLLSNVVAGNWAVLLDSVAGSRNQTYSISTSVQSKSTDRNGWQCDRFGYCTAVASPSRTVIEQTTSPSVIQGDQNNQNPASRVTMGFLFIFAFIFVAFF